MPRRRVLRRVLARRAARARDAEVGLVALLNEVMETARNPHHNLYLASCAAAGDVRVAALRAADRADAPGIAHSTACASRASRRGRPCRGSRARRTTSRRRRARRRGLVGHLPLLDVLYLGAQGDDFDGGSFAFSDPDATAPGSRAEPAEPVARPAVFFSSGWENMHRVAPVLSGTRFAVPAFFVTRPPRLTRRAATTRRRRTRCGGRCCGRERG